MVIEEEAIREICLGGRERKLVGGRVDGWREGEDTRLQQQH